MRIETAAAALCVVAAGWLQPVHATADPGSGDGTTYAQVEKALKAQGYTAIQTTSIGDQVPKSQCTVTQQLISSNGHVMLSLDCRGTPKATGAGPTAIDTAAG